MRHAWLAVLLLLSGCAHWDLPPVTERSVSVSVASSDWLEEARRVQLMPAALQPGEMRQRELAHQAEATAASGLRLALLLVLGSETVRDEPRALTLLDRLDPDSLDLSQAALADLLRQWVRERRRSLELLRAERKALAERDARIQELESQLEAVTSIEQSIRQRQKPLQGVEP